MLQIKLLGVPEVTLDGRVVRVKRRGSLALLAYLALTDRVHARESIAQQLVGDNPEAQARKLLSNVLVDLRHELGDYVVSDAQGIRFEKMRPHSIDVAEFRKRSVECLEDPALTRLEAAITLYRGEFLAGLAPSGTNALDCWQTAEAEDLRDRYLELLRTHLDAAVREGAWATALRSARRLLMLEPWLEDIHRQLMRVLARSGQRRAALVQYQTCRRILREELAAEPSDETIALFNRIRAASAPPPHNLPAPATHLVGRARELRALAGRLAEPGCRLVSICGLSGSGKTRLGLEVARSFTAPDCPPPEQPFPDGIFVIRPAESEPVDEARPGESSVLASNAALAIVATIASALGLEDVGAPDTLSRLKCFLAPRAMLLVLDDLDELRAGAQILTELLACAAQLKLLVTTRAALRLPSEHVVQLDGLRVPRSIEELETAEASALFLQEARRLWVGFVLPESQRPHLARLCQVVGGFPLALILAARWANVVPCGAIVEELQAGLGLEVLHTTDADLPARHQSVASIVREALTDAPNRGATELAQLAKLPTAPNELTPFREAPATRSEPVPAYSRTADLAACAA